MKLFFSLNFFISFFLLVATFNLSQVNIYAAFQSDYSKRKSEIDQQVSALKNQLESTNIDFHSVQSRKKTLQEELSFLESEILKNKELIKSTETSINNIELQIKDNQNQIVKLQVDKKVIIQEIQKKDKISPLQVVLTSQSLSSAISEIYNLSSLQNKLDELQDKINETNKELELNQESLRTTKQNLEQAEGLIKVRQAEIQTLLEQTQNDEQKYQQLIASLQSQEDNLNKQKVVIDQEYQESLKPKPPVSGGNSSSGPVGTPAPSPGAGGCGRIREMGGSFPAEPGDFVRPTSGTRTQGFTCTHDALDIANSTGTPIYSIAAGTIVSNSFQPGGYGNYIVIKHTINNQVILSVYAHMSTKTSKGPGSSVSKGEQIGGMGASGYATGTHLHFSLIGSYSGAVGCDSLYGGTSYCYNPAKYPFNF